MSRLLCVLVLAAAPAIAQPARNFFPWWDMPVARDLNLRDDQQKQIREITREYRGKLIDLRGQVEKTELELEDLFDEDNFDTQRAIQVSDKLAASRTELTRAFATMNARLRGVLTAQQWRELRKRQPGRRGAEPLGPPGGGGPEGGRGQREEMMRRRNPGPPPPEEN